MLVSSTVVWVSFLSFVYFFVSSFFSFYGEIRVARWLQAQAYTERYAERGNDPAALLCTRLKTEQQ